MCSRCSLLRSIGLTLTLTLLLWLPAWSGALQTLRFDSLRGERALGEDPVLVSLQDGRGQMWLGTTNGLLRFDGRRLRRFAAEPGDAAALSHPQVHALLETPAGRLWLGTGAGLDELDLSTETLRRHRLPEPRLPAERRVMQVLPAGEGQLWLATPKDLLRFDVASGRFRTVPLPSVAPAGEGLPLQLRALISDGQDGAWLALGAEVLQLDAQDRVLRRLALRRPAAGVLTVRSLALDGSGRLWVGSADGVQVLDLWDGSQSELPDRLGLPRDIIHALRIDAEGSVWIGSGNQGLWRWREGAPGVERHSHHPALARSLASNAVASLYQDRSGVLWVGDWSGGVSLVDLASGGFRSYLSVIGDPLSLSHPQVQAVLPDDAWHVWVGTYGGGLNRLHLSSGEVERLDLQTLPLTHVKALLQQPGVGLWVGGDGGLWQLDPLSRRSRRIDLGSLLPATLSISALLLDARSQVWAASAAGVHRIAPDGSRRTFRTGADSGLSHDVVDSLLEDDAGRLWLGSKGGLQLWDASAERFVQPVLANADCPNPQELMVYALRQDGRGRLWLGTQLGLYQLLPAPPDGAAPRWQLKSWRHLPGMPQGWIHGLQDAHDGALWLVSAHGLSRLDVELKQLRHYPARSGRFEGGFSFGATARASDGSLFFGGKGLLQFHPSTLRDNPTPPDVQISDLRIFNRSLLGPSEDEAVGLPSGAASSLQALGIDGPLSLARRLQLSHREAMVSFELTALHFYNSSLNRYAWRLEGFDADWIHGTPGEGLATYTNLDPGRYRLLAKAASPDGAWSEPRQLLEITVAPPWWRSTWFRAALLLGLLLALAAAWRLRLRVLERVQQRLETEVRNRTAEVQAQQRQLVVEKQDAERGRQQIAKLSEIGRELTASLDLGAIQATLYKHVDALMPAAVFGVGLVRWDERTIDFDFVLQRGQHFKPYRRSLDTPEQPACRCVLGGEALLIAELATDNRELDVQARERSGEQQVQLLGGGVPLAARSALYVPMLLKGQVIGVISVLSDLPDAYRPTDLDILRTLGAYAAVALDNAEAYRRLKITQAQLVEQEKLASLGALVAGVAHELNTPIGNSLLVASTLNDSSQRFVAQARSGTLRRSDLERFCSSSEEASGLLVRSLSHAAQLVTSFKQLAVDQTSDQRRHFELASICEGVALTLANRLRRDEHSLELEVPAELHFDSYPGPLEQVLSNLVLNALLHGFEDRTGGRMLLKAEAVGGDWVRMSFSDNGRGIAPEHLPRVFDPFFTTKLGNGGSGLGLHICYTIVSSLLGGQITVSSELGQGTRFELMLPRVAPLATAEEAAAPAGPGVGAPRE